ncbi:MAG: HDOD domain-containing protein [Candidatus Acidiferrales bacterium]
MMKRFLARQPIFTPHKAVFGYELLCRNGPENFFHKGDSALGSSAAVDDLFLFGLDRLTQGRLAFINCSREFLVREYLSLLPRELVVGEILENLQPDAETLEACRRLKNAGYRFALDDFVDVPEARPFIEVADFIKVDFLTTSPPEQERLARNFTRHGIPLVAEKVETHEIFKQAVDMGYSFFQGYFFCRPQMLERRDVPAYKLNYLRVLQAVNRREIDIAEVTAIIKQEASLSYRLLRYLNSPAFGLVAEVHSIPHGLSLLGENGVRKWVSLVSVAAMGEDKPGELIMLPLVRARFCELLAPPAGLRNSENDLFLMGLLSAMDAILDMPMSKILAEISVNDDIRDALLGQPGRFRAVYEIAVNYETGTWEQLADPAEELGLTEDMIPDLFMQALEWAKHVIAGNPAPVTS